MEQTPYSFHTFLLPFVWEGTGSRSVSFKEFKKIFDNNPNWENTDIADISYNSNAYTFGNLKECQRLYEEYRFFHPHVRKAIYGLGSDIVSNYTFRYKDTHNKGHYYIKKDGVEYDLLLCSIKLKIFNTGIAILIIEGQNLGFARDKKTSQANFEAVRNINEYGRNVTLPSIYCKKRNSHCADKLTISIPDVVNIEENFSGFLSRIKDENCYRERVTLTHISELLKELLSFGSNFRFSSKPGNDKNTYYISTALDDRMFVVSYVMDTNIVETMLAEDDKGEPIYLNDKALSKSMFEFIYSEASDRCTCYDGAMRRKKLSEHLYTRWSEKKMLIGCTDRALTVLTKDMTENNKFLAHFYLTVYVQTCVLVQAQRTSILNFQIRSSDISAHIEEKGKKVKLSTISKIMNLQESFVAFQNQLDFVDVTAQQQGFEVYDLLMKASYVMQEKQALMERLSALSNTSNISLDYNFNKWALVFAIPTLVFESIGFLLETTGYSALGKIRGAGIFGILVLFVFFVLFYYRRKR